MLISLQLFQFFLIEFLFYQQYLTQDGNLFFLGGGGGGRGRGLRDYL